MGTLLELGPERNMGSHDMGVLSGIYPLQTPPEPETQNGIEYITRFVRSFANVLVRHQLPSIRARGERSHVQFGLVHSREFAFGNL